MLQCYGCFDTTAAECDSTKKGFCTKNVYVDDLHLTTSLTVNHFPCM